MDKDVVKCLDCGRETSKETLAKMGGFCPNCGYGFSAETLAKLPPLDSIE